MHSNIAPANRRHSSARAGTHHCRLILIVGSGAGNCVEVVIWPRGPDSWRSKQFIAYFNEPMANPFRWTMEAKLLTQAKKNVSFLSVC